MSILDDEWQRLAANAICHAAEMTTENIRGMLADYSAPAVMYRPALSIDGNQWCALYGDNLQGGVAGFGDSPEKAMRDFNRAWYAALGEGK